jgi:putative addiction module component (TIGR02574 family)
LRWWKRSPDSIAADSAAVPLTTPQCDELDRWLADHGAHPNEALSWDQVKASLDERLKKWQCGRVSARSRVMILGRSSLVRSRA